ncbi:MAG TPA: hypothetical protein VJ576_16155 [Rhodocyclaceae bacterium]|nr:hypothetical protein [Rhodocyclaceae bacterium]
MLNLIPTQPRLALALLLVSTLLLAAAGVYGGYWLTAAWYRPRLEAAEAKAKALEDAYLTLAGITQRQNEAITALHADTERRRLAGMAAQAQARAQAQPHLDQAAAFQGLSLPPGSDPCHTAQQWVDEALQRERSQ